MWKGPGYVFGAGFLLLSIFLVPACSSAKPEATSGNPDEALVCVRERPTGSHVAVRTCRTRAQIEAEKQAAKETMDEIDRTQSVITPDA